MITSSLLAMSLQFGLALDFPNWAGFTSGVAPQTVTFTNHGTLTVSNVVGMTPGYPIYYNYTGLNNLPAPFTNTMPSLWPKGAGTFSWTAGFTPPLTEMDYVIMADVDNSEQATISAFDAAGQPVAVTNWQQTLVDPYLPDSGFLGTVTRTNNRIQITGSAADASEEMAIFRPAAGQAVARLDYTYDIGAGAGGTFTFATTDCGCCPSLAVLRRPSDVLVSWPASGSNCTLQTTVNLVPSNWTNWPSAPTLNGATLEQAVVPDPTTRFFRLKRP